MRLPKRAVTWTKLCYKIENLSSADIPIKLNHLCSPSSFPTLPYPPLYTLTRTHTGFMDPYFRLVVQQLVLIMLALASSRNMTLTRPTGVCTQRTPTHARVQRERSPVGLLGNSEHMIDYLRNCSSEKHFIPQRVRKNITREFGEGESEREMCFT